MIADTAARVWRSEFGDNDLLGWSTTAAYLLVAVLCARTARAAAPSGSEPPRANLAEESPRPWWVLSAGFLLLGLNKQLDLQIFVREWGLRLLSAMGLEGQWRWAVRLFTLLLALFLLRVMATAARMLGRSTRGHRLLLTGLALLACFAVARAGVYVPGLRRLNLRFGKALHLVFEFGGVLLAGLAAWRTRHRLVRHQSSSMSSA